MEKETKKYLIIGTTIVVVVGIGVFLWKKHQSGDTNAAAAPTGTDQATQDELSLLAATLENNAYAGSDTGTGAPTYAAAAVGAGLPQSLAAEVTALEQALGFAPTPTTPSPAPPVTPSSSGSGSGSTHPTATPPAQPVAQPIVHSPNPELEMDGVHHNLDGVLVA